MGVCFCKDWSYCPDPVAQLAGHRTAKQKATSSIPGQGRHLDYEFGTQLGSGEYERQPTC